ncbi:hypothetical protein ACFQ08_25300, partial [Streptosporangium algeriense]
MRRQRRFDPERRLLIRTRRRITAQVAGGFSLVLALMGAMVYYVMVNGQDVAARRDLAVAVRSASITQPPPCMWLFELRGDVVRRSPGSPDRLPVRAFMDLVAADGRPRVEVAKVGGQTYLVRTQQRDGVTAQAVMDLRFRIADREQLLRTLGAAEFAGLLAALLIGQVLAGRAI